MSSDTKKSGEVDIWRDTPVRLLGYANEVGESFRSLVHVNVVRASYAVAFGYCLADTVHKTNNMSKRKDVTNSLIVTTAADTLLWQTLASVSIPGYTINRLCTLSLFLLKKTKLSTPVQKWATVAVGIGSIPFIVKPIDHLVDYIMDRTFRQVFPPPPPSK